MCTKSHENAPQDPRYGSCLMISLQIRFRTESKLKVQGTSQPLSSADSFTNWGLSAKAGFASRANDSAADRVPNVHSLRSQAFLQARPNERLFMELLGVGKTSLQAHESIITSKSNNRILYDIIIYYHNQKQGAWLCFYIWAADLHNLEVRRGVHLVTHFWYSRE